MKLPFIFPASGGGSGYHETPFDQDDFDADNQDDNGSESTEADFDEYLWMEHEEEFDKNELQRLEEEELAKACMEDMLEDGYDGDSTAESDSVLWVQHGEAVQDIYDDYSGIGVQAHDVENSTLNPLAKEFVPSSVTH